MDSSLQDLQQIFEYELKRKLSERAKFSSGEMRVLLNGFRFFDINYTGIITKAQWIQGILRTGLTGFSESDLEMLFNLYDKNNTGQIDYKNFCGFIYGREPLSPLTNNSQSLQIEQNNNNKNNNSNNNNYENNNPNIYNNTNIEEQYNQNNNSNNSNTPAINYNNNDNFNNNINIINSNNKRETPFINNNQYNILNNQQRQTNSPNNNYFNNNQNDNFGYNMRTPINNVEYQENSNFRRSQRKINSYTNTFNNIFQQETDPSMFKKRNNYNLSESAINSIIISIRNNININNGITFFTFIKNLKMRETNNFQISINDLYNLFQEMRIKIPYNELKILFNYANRNDSDIISTEKLINIIKGTLDEQRKLYIVEVFSNMDTQHTGKVSVQLLKNIFNTKSHPEVINGTKTQEEIFEQFCYSLDLFCEINGIPKDGELSLEKFVDYYSSVSASIPDEVYFEDMINGVWSNINNNNNSNNNININTNQNINYDNNNSYNINKNINNNTLMEINNNIKNDSQKNVSNSNNNYNNGFKNSNNQINNINQMDYNYEKRIKNSMSSPYIRENNNNKYTQMNYNNNYRNSNNNNINNIILSPYDDYEKSKNFYNKPQVAASRGKASYQNKNKRRYNPILDEYYPEIPKNSINTNEIEEKDIISHNLPRNNYQLYQKQNCSNIGIFNNKDINVKANITPNANNINNLSINNSNSLINLRNLLISRGLKNLFAFQRMLTIYDRNNSGLISLEDFKNIFQIYNLNLPISEVKNIFDNYNNPEQIGTIHYPSLVNDLIGQMNEKRINMVETVFNNFTKNEKGEVSIKEIKQAYNPGGHPDVLNRKKTPNEVYGEFLDMLEIYREYIYNIKGGYITSITLEDFKQFYSEISLGFKDDYAFENMMVNCWNLGWNNKGININNDNIGNNYGYDRNIRARTGKQIMNMNNRGY